MFRKLIYGVIIFVVLFMLGAAGRVYWNDVDAAVIAAKIENDFPFTPLPEPADPNGGLPACKALSDYCDDHKEQTPEVMAETHRLVTNAVIRLVGYVPSKNVEKRFEAYPFGVLEISRFYLNASKTAQAAGDREAFVRYLGEHKFACEELPSPVFLMDAIVTDIYLFYRLEMLANLASFPSTPLSELEAALASLPSDDALVRRMVNIIANEYYHAALPVFDDLPNILSFSEKQKIYAWLPRVFFHSRAAGSAFYLRGMEAVCRALPLPAAERTEFNAFFDSVEWQPKHWYDRNLVGCMLFEMIAPLFLDKTDAVRDRVNLCRLGIAGQIFYRRNQRPPASLAELVTEGLLPAIPVRYLAGKPFLLVQHESETKIVLENDSSSVFFRVISPDPAAGPIWVKEDFTCNAD